MGAQCFSIIGSDAGVQTNVKPYLIPEKAFQALENAYAFRKRIKKRESLRLLGRLRRVISAQVVAGIYGTINGTNTLNIFTALGITGEPNANIEAGRVAFPIVLVIAATGQTLTDSTGTGVFTIAPAGTITAATINYATGVVSITATAVTAPAAVTFTLGYFPSFPVMGIFQREIGSINSEETVFFDTKYAYKFGTTGFEELVPGGATWQGTDSDFFWCTNYRGIVATQRLFFATNFNNGVTPDPIRYYDGIWNNFAPLVSATDTLYQARIILPYYGRLLMFNTWEGTTAGGQAGASNFFNRCRFSQIGDPIAATAFRSDIFGKGGFIDAPTNEAIISAAFIKNTLIIFFEKTTWQLRYVGEYGLPFLWERISSDFGSESTNSPVLFDTGVLAMGDKGIISANALGVNRIDLQIPDLVFDIRNAQDGVKRVIGVRDYQQELVYWCYSDADLQRKFPNTVIVYNYRNNTYSFFRDNVTFFGTFQPSTGITWGRTDIFWGDFGTFWKNGKSQSDFPFIVSGNQQGFCHYYNDETATQDAESLAISSITLSNPVRLTVINHNLEDGDIIYITDVIYSGTQDFNGNLFSVQRIDPDTIDLLFWDFGDQSYANFTSTSTGTYQGNGKIALFPKLYALTKDFNPFLAQGSQLKLMYVDFLMDDTESDWTVQLYINASLSTQVNMLVGNKETTTNLTSPYYVPLSQYAWQRFYATAAGQFISLALTYDDNQMNTLETHQKDWELNSMNLWVRPGGKTIF